MTPITVSSRCEKKQWTLTQSQTFTEVYDVRSLYRMTLLLAGVAVAGCAPYEGRYVPDCTAYAGSIISLHDAQFVWERFTDQVRIGDDGQPIEPFPGYPKRGSYRKEGDALYLETAGGESVETLHLHEDGETFRILTVQEQQTWERTGEYPRCVLTLEETQQP